MKSLFLKIFLSVVGVTSLKVATNIDAAIFYSLIGIVLGLNVFFIAQFCIKKYEATDPLQKSKTAKKNETKKDPSTVAA